MWRANELQSERGDTRDSDVSAEVGTGWREGMMYANTVGIGG